MGQKKKKKKINVERSEMFLHTYDKFSEKRNKKDSISTKEIEVKRTKVCYVYVPTPHSGCNHYVLQTYINKN